MSSVRAAAQCVRRRERPGFDAMVGNPPWDKLEPKRKEFFAQYDPAIPDFQGQTLARRITQLAPAGSKADLCWHAYESIESSLAKLLINGGVYQHQVVEVNGEKTGGKPDLSRSSWNVFINCLARVVVSRFSCLPDYTRWKGLRA